MIETKFKHTDIGLVPEDWEVKKLSTITDIVTGGTPSTDVKGFWGGNIRWMNSGELNLKFVYDVEGRITQDGLNHSSTQIIPSNCVLIGLAGQGKTRGTAAYNFVSLCINQSIGAIIPNKSFDTHFMYYQIDGRYQELRMLSSGDGGRGGLNKQILQNLNIVLPPLSEQHRIASALMKVDALISNLDKLIQKKQAIKKGAMQELLTGRKRLPGFKGEWKERRLGDIFDIKAGGDVDKEHFSITQNNVYKYPVYSNSFVNHGLYGFTSLPKYESNSITITGRGYLGHSEYRNIPFDAVVRILVLSPKYHVDCYLVSEIINFIHPFILESTSIPQLTAPQVMETMVYIPTDISEQRAIAHVLSTMDSEISVLEEKRDKYRQIKLGMMRDLLTGRIRLVENVDKESKLYSIGMTKDPSFEEAIVAEPHPD